MASSFYIHEVFIEIVFISVQERAALGRQTIPCEFKYTQKCVCPLVSLVRGDIHSWREIFSCHLCASCCFVSETISNPAETHPPFICCDIDL